MNIRGVCLSTVLQDQTELKGTWELISVHWRCNVTAPQGNANDLLGK